MRPGGLHRASPCRQSHLCAALGRPRFPECYRNQGFWSKTLKIQWKIAPGGHCNGKTERKYKIFSDLGNTAATVAIATIAATALEPEPEMRRAPSLTVVAYTNSLK